MVVSCDVCTTSIDVERQGLTVMGPDAVRHPGKKLCHTCALGKKYSIVWVQKNGKETFISETDDLPEAWAQFHMARNSGQFDESGSKLQGRVNR